jgi:hypothetical protein
MYLSENLKSLKLEDFNVATLRRLKDKTESSNLAFPHQIPKKVCSTTTPQHKKQWLRTYY